MLETTDPIPRIVRKSLTEEVAGLVRDLIIAGELAAGTKIPEADLCVRFGVSRTPLREALKMLAAEGLVSLALNRGARVATTTTEEIEALFPIIGALEGLAGERAAALATAAERTDLEALHASMVAEFQRGDWLAYSKLNRRIHEAIFAASGNAPLAQLYQQLLVRTHAVRFVARKSPARWQQAVDEHEQMMVAFRARDGARLGAILRLHLAHKADTVQETLARQR
jgi:DNA-binding GntR family transcriptional regulator